MQADKSADSPVARAAACGKVNFTLEIKGLREDGFHDLRSLAIGVDLCDQIRCKANPGRGLSLSCSDPGLSNAGNLAWRAVELLASRCGLAPDVEIELIKSIPVGAGMGGGSSDAATTLRLCNDLWRVGLDRSSLADLGADLGSDVPLFFSLPSVVITGRGEHVEPVTMRWSGWVVLVFAGVAVSTAEVYRAWRREDARDMPSGLDDDIVRAANLLQQRRFIMTIFPIQLYGPADIEIVLVIQNVAVPGPGEVVKAVGLQQVRLEWLLCIIVVHIASAPI